MSINLNTGSVQVPKAPHSYPNTGQTAFKKEEYTNTTPAEMVVFPSEHRRILVVEPKTMLVVTGYNLDNQTKVSFRKILRSNGVPAQGSNGCCPTITVGHSVRLHSVELPCWILNNCNPVFIVKTPGNYEIDVIGASADVVVTAMQFDMQEVNDFGGCDCMTPAGPVIPAPIVEPILHQPELVLE